MGFSCIDTQGVQLGELVVNKESLFSDADFSSLLLHLYHDVIGTDTVDSKFIWALGSSEVNQVELSLLIFPFLVDLIEAQNQRSVRPG